MPSVSPTLSIGQDRYSTPKIEGKNLYECLQNMGVQLGEDVSGAEMCPALGESFSQLRTAEKVNVTRKILQALMLPTGSSDKAERSVMTGKKEII